jgi:hypothetical protein
MNVYYSNMKKDNQRWDSKLTGPWVTNISSTNNWFWFKLCSLSMVPAAFCCYGYYYILLNYNDYKIEKKKRTYQRCSRIDREGEREKERERKRMLLCMCTYVYIYIYISREAPYTSIKVWAIKPPFLGVNIAWAIASGTVNLLNCLATRFIRIGE